MIYNVICKKINVCHAQDVGKVGYKQICRKKTLPNAESVQSQHRSISQLSPSTLAYTLQPNNNNDNSPFWFTNVTASLDII